MTVKGASTHLPSKAESKQLSIDALHGAHRDVYTHAITRVLSTREAETTYAQLIDGLPFVEVVNDTLGDVPHMDHPIYDAHAELCPGVLDEARGFRDSFDAGTIQFDSAAAAPGSRAFNTRLIEMVAVVTHQIAVLLFKKRDTNRHKDDGITEWAPPKSDDFYWGWFPDGPLPTMFTHPWFIDHEQYPNRAADMAGYWAEGRILGGVVLFDRYKTESDSVYLHPDREDGTYRIYELLSQQKRALLDFLTVDSPGACPLPILGGDSNRNRVDPEEPLEATGIYRDIWERKTRTPLASDERMRDVRDTVDFPTSKDKGAASRRARERLWRYERGDDWEDPDIWRQIQR